MRDYPIGRRSLLAAGAGLAAAASGGPAAAQSGRTGRAIVGFPAGGTADLVTRLYTEQLRRSLGQQMVVENRPGAGGRLALETLKPLAPDGGAFAVTPAGMLTIYPHLYTRTLRYDAAADFTAVSPVCEFPFGFGVIARHPARSMAEFVTWSKARGTVEWASPVPGSAPHFMGTQLAGLAGLTLNHVPYRGSAPAVQDLLAGNIQAVMLPIGDLTAFHRSGDVRLLAVSSERRLPRLPDVPTFAEAGLGALTGSEWYGVFLPAGASAETLSRLHGALVAAAATPEIQEGLTRIDMTPVTLAPDAFRARIAQETRNWRDIVAASGFKPEE